MSCERAELGEDSEVGVSCPLAGTVTQQWTNTRLPTSSLGFITSLQTGLPLDLAECV